MCFLKNCKDRYNVHEKIAAHDYYEQMANFNGTIIKEPKKKRLTKKSLKARIENSLNELQNDLIAQQTFLYDELNNLIINNSLDNLEEINSQFDNIMTEYYKLKLRQEFKYAS